MLSWTICICKDEKTNAFLLNSQKLGIFLPLQILSVWFRKLAVVAFVSCSHSLPYWRRSPQTYFLPLNFRILFKKPKLVKASKYIVVGDGKVSKVLNYLFLNKSLHYNKYSLCKKTEIFHISKKLHDFLCSHLLFTWIFPLYRTNSLEKVRELGKNSTNHLGALLITVHSCMDPMRILEQRFSHFQGLFFQ